MTAWEMIEKEESSRVVFYESHPEISRSNIFSVRATFLDAAERVINRLVEENYSLKAELCRKTPGKCACGCHVSTVME